MATPSSMVDLSTTAASNSPAGSESPTAGDDFLRAIQAILRHTNAKGADIASATTTDIGAATGEFVDVTGTTTITGLGTIAAGIVRTVRFTGALTLTHNATSLILPSSANITTAANDVAQFRSLGSGNWLCVGYIPAAGYVRPGANSSITSLTGLTTALSVAQGGTGATTNAGTAYALKGANSDITSLTALTVQNTAIVTSASGGVGYGVGAGGSVTQITSKTTAVTLNKPTGLITMHNAALAAGATASFQVNNSTVDILDVPVVTVYNNSSYVATAYYSSAGAFGIRITNVTGGSLSEAVNINFAIIKSVSS